MMLSSMHYFPLPWPFLLALFAILVMVIILVELRILSYAYRRLGIAPRWVFVILLLSLVGSYVNIPVARLPSERVVSDLVVTYFGVPWEIPAVHQWPGTIIAVNVGGALIPTLLSIYLIFHNRFFIRSIVAVAGVAAIVHTLATPVKGLGISVPIFVPPLIAAGVAMILAWKRAPALAYVAGSLGTLIGADLLNLGKIHSLQAPIASIGGAGTFDGVFLTGIIAVLLPPIAPAPDEPVPEKGQTPPLPPDFHAPP